MHLVDDDGCIYEDIYDYRYSNGIHYVSIILDTLRRFEFDSEGNQISYTPCYKLVFTDGKEDWSTFPISRS